MKVKNITSNRLSTFRTENTFSSYGEIRCLDDYAYYLDWARQKSIPLFILGNGTNTFFKRTNIKSLVVKNCLKKEFEEIEKGKICVSSSVSVLRILKYCQKNSLDCFYFLASVPATVGGALAMNAGLGYGGTVFDFVQELTYYDNGTIVTRQRNEIELKHRQTIFTGVQDKLILSAIFVFPEKKFDDSPIERRMSWCKKHQDIYSPNCGSVFREYDSRILKLCRKFRIPQFGVKLPMAHFSGLVNNWIINEGKSSWTILLAIRVAQFLHILVGSRAKTEIIEVE